MSEFSESQMEGIKKGVNNIINQLAYARGKSYENYARIVIRREIYRLRDSGLSAEEALDRIIANPPVVNPNY